ncbi:sulfite exporter TauE/SafE family protein [Acuticoccus kandeliae]|uniref:sulfite exporter TauE/SafE family protein n=1 Tax=Acuticoccus kandeliae TaxID=2073160 RepID=UPI000D3E6ABA|nr:sulfite exporter TauE/SafE family protein [Acuticoccus kandeliae]
MSEIVTLALALAVAGAFTGILAGLFGVGGGAIIVPVLYEVFRFNEVPEELRMPLAVGTSLAIIIPTSIRSARAHAKKGGVDMMVLRTWALPVMVGVSLGAFIAHYAPPEVFQFAFIIVASLMSTKLLFGRQSWRLGDDLPGRPVLATVGAVIGTLSSLMGIGGGAISTVFLTLYGRPIHNAVATSAGVGVLISIPGTIGYILAGWGKAGLPPDALGFVSLLGFALIVPTTLLTAPLGVNLAHRLSRRTLEVMFGSFLVIVCVRFVIAALG